jgi:phage terminase large subunit
MKQYNVVVLHRGAGKSYLAVNELIKRAVECTDKSGTIFVYIAPEKQQAKDIIWAKLKYFTGNIEGLKIREDELTVTFPHNNATIRLEGADRPDRLRGIHPHFVVLDEVGQMKRDTWYEVIMPSIQRNNGSVLFIGTPKGENLFKELYDIGLAINDDRWFVYFQHVYQTGVYDEEKIRFFQLSMPPAKFEQEYLCRFDAIFTGAYYSDMLLDETKGIITDVPYNPMYEVVTGWDFGTRDKTVIWFAQVIDGKYNFFDYYENSGPDIYHYMNILKQKPYRYSYHIVPHDATHRGWETGTTRLAIFKTCGFRTVSAKKLSPEEGISMVQANLYTTRFDKNKCRKGITHLMAYRSKVDQVSGAETGEPLHDAASDAADALRTFFVGVRRHEKPTSQGHWHLKSEEEESKHIVADYDYFNWK